MHPDLQNTFYFLAIILMILAIAILVWVGIGLLVVTRKISHAKKAISDKVNFITYLASYFKRKK